MDIQAIALLVQTLGPIVIPILVNFITWLGNKALTTVSPGTQAAIKPFLPIVAGVLGAVGGSLTGDGAVTGVVSGLAATGLHQAVTQPLKKS